MIKEFSISVSHTVNLGNGNSMRAEASITIAVPETASVNGAALNALKAKAQSDLRTLVRETWEQQKKQQTEQSNERSGTKSK